MEEMEFLKKMFIEKEKENLKLKQEIEQIKNQEDNTTMNDFLSQPNSNANELEDSPLQQGNINKFESNYYSQNVLPLNISQMSRNKPNLNYSTVVNDKLKMIGTNLPNSSFIADNSEKYFSNKVIEM
jgi:hypothetical protein